MPKTTETQRKNSVFVLFGATGDLAVKKIFPALAALHAEGALGPDPRIVGVSRRDWNDAAFHAFLADGGAQLPATFLAHLSYSKVDIDAGTGYAELAQSLKKLQKGLPESEVVYYTSLAPALHGEAIKGLRDAGLLMRGVGRVLIEKPFGTDQKTACALDRFLGSFLDQDQIYRVDHYLGKDTVRAVMDLHESTPDLSALISSEAVKSIRVRMLEEKGIDGRGASYDGVGAFRDVGQNHMLEMLAAIAAEVAPVGPGVSGASEGFAWQKARAEVFERLAPPAKTCELSRRGQYVGYHDEKGVKPHSETETAFEVITNLRSGKLKSVPLVLQSGKKMGKSVADIAVEFKDVSGLPKRIVFSVQPEQEIVIENRDGTVESFDIPKTRDAYGNIIAAALDGSEKDFVGSEEIEALWGYADHVVACWGKVPLERYSPEEPFLVE